MHLSAALGGWSDSRDSRRALARSRPEGYTRRSHRPTVVRQRDPTLPSPREDMTDGRYDPSKPQTIRDTISYLCELNRLYKYELQLSCVAHAGGIRSAGTSFGTCSTNETSCLTSPDRSIINLGNYTEPHDESAIATFSLVLVDPYNASLVTHLDRCASAGTRVYLDWHAWVPRLARVAISTGWTELRQCRGTHARTGTAKLGPRSPRSRTGEAVCVPVCSSAQLALSTLRPGIFNGFIAEQRAEDAHDASLAE
jgi:hypothetical protein